MIEGAEKCPRPCLLSHVEALGRAIDSGSRVRICPALARLATMYGPEPNDNVDMFYRRVGIPDCIDSVSHGGPPMTSQIVEELRAENVVLALIGVSRRANPESRVDSWS